MKNLAIILISTMMILGAFIGSVDTAENNDAPQLYTCGMHPQIISDEPGFCPICEMKLTPKRKSGSNSSEIIIDPTTTQNMGLVTTEITNDYLTKTVQAFGKVDYNEPDLYDVTLKFNGWVEKLFVNYEGEEVYKGQPLLEIYSPELVAAQKELLILNKSKSITALDNNLVEIASERLSNWDISSDQIKNILATGKIIKNVIIRSGASGIVIEKNVKEGSRLTAATVVYKIADISKVWVKGYIYEQDAPFVSLGQNARVRFPNLSQKVYDAKVSYISTFLNPRHQIEIRMIVKNEDNLLKPEMYAEIVLNSTSASKKMQIPRRAVIYSGTKTGVYLARGNDTYQYQQVELGALGNDDLIEVKDGLSLSDKVIVSGQFLLDSESRLNEAIGMIGGHNHGQSSNSDSKEKNEASKHNMEDMEETKKEDHSSHAQNMNKSSKADMTSSEIYTCPMPVHYNVLQYGQGKCPECNMNLVPVSQTDNKDFYVCPMEQDQVVQSEPGNCPKCNMKLVKSNPRGSK